MAQKQRGQGLVVVGGQWGDEGKGRIVDALSERADVVVRFQGGNNAGHSLHIGDTSIVLHVVPCGIMRPEKICMIGNGVVIDPEVLFQEIDMLRSHDVEVFPHNLKIAKNAHIIFPFHKSVDAARESTSSALGTTKRGIGPCYEDKVGRLGILAQDLLSTSVLRKKLEKIATLRHFGEPLDIDALTTWAHAAADRLAPFLCDVGHELDSLVKQGKNVLFEGAQGALLDIDHGSYPFVTSSNCVAAQAAIGSGIGPRYLDDVLIVTKAYCTRVGEGPFFCEASAEQQSIFRALGNEFGATTGRPRRCGWLDLPALKYAARINGACGIVLTKVDILAGLLSLKVGVDYAVGEHRGLSFVDAMEAFHQGFNVEVIYQDLAPVEKIPDHVWSFAEFPKSVRDLCHVIESFVELPIRIISYGSKRGQELFIDDSTTNFTTRRP